MSWSAVFAGAFAMGALSLVLMVLGAGVGLSSVSPWPNVGTDVSRVSAIAIIWLMLAQSLASLTGGYLTGRLRTKWVSVHTHEVYFRDTAHGFIAWAVALVISTILFASFATSIATNRPTNQRDEYFVDMLLRTDHPIAAKSDPSLRGEAVLVLADALRHPTASRDDQAYLDNLVAAATGLSQGDAERRARLPHILSIGFWWRF